MTYAQSVACVRPIASSEAVIAAFTAFGREHIRSMGRGRIAFIGRVIHDGKETIEVRGGRRTLDRIPDTFQGFPVLKIIFTP